MLHRIDNLQDGWVVEVRRRLSGKAAGQIYKLWISPRGEQIWTKTLGLKKTTLIDHLSIREFPSFGRHPKAM